MERARKKALQVLERDGEHKASRPYVREGGIFGRKKETEEGEDKTKRRERGICNGNLWIYINGQDFDKPGNKPMPMFSTEGCNTPQAATEEQDQFMEEAEKECEEEEVEGDHYAFDEA